VRATVKADPIAVVLVHHVSGVNVMNHRGVHVRDARVVEILAASPVAAIEAAPWITESIGNATVEADYWTPVTGIPDIEAVGKCPVPGSPQKTHLRRKDPNARDPVISVGAVSPVTRFPDIAGTWTKRLAITGRSGGPMRMETATPTCAAGLGGAGMARRGIERTSELIRLVIRISLTFLASAGFVVLACDLSPFVGALLLKRGSMKLWF
jgi:hypothetical protein